MLTRVSAATLGPDPLLDVLPLNKVPSRTRAHTHTHRLGVFCRREFGALLCAHKPDGAMDVCALM
jgi:hypothetical protein